MKLLMNIHAIMKILLKKYVALFIMKKTRNQNIFLIWQVYFIKLIFLYKIRKKLFLQNKDIILKWSIILMIFIHIGWKLMKTESNGFSRHSFDGVLGCSPEIVLNQNLWNILKRTREWKFYLVCFHPCRFDWVFSRGNRIFRPVIGSNIDLHSSLIIIEKLIFMYCFSLRCLFKWVSYESCQCS